MKPSAMTEQKEKVLQKAPVVCCLILRAGLMPFLRKTKLRKDGNKQQHASRYRDFPLNNPVVKKKKKKSNLH